MALISIAQHKNIVSSQLWQRHGIFVYNIYKLALVIQMKFSSIRVCFALLIDET